MLAAPFTFGASRSIASTSSGASLASLLGLLGASLAIRVERVFLRPFMLEEREMEAASEAEVKVRARERSTGGDHDLYRCGAGAVRRNTRKRRPASANMLTAATANLTTKRRGKNMINQRSLFSGRCCKAITLFAAAMSRLGAFSAGCSGAHF